MSQPMQPPTVPTSSRATMRALVYHGPGQVAWEEHLKPELALPTDAIVRLTTTTLCGTDLHILHGEVPTVTPGRILGHEGVGIVESVGSAVMDFQIGDRVVIGVITACGRCGACKRAMPSHCVHGGWQLGNTIDGTQAEFVRVPSADNGLHHLPASIQDESAVMLSCALPTAYECGILSGTVKPGDTVAIVGAGPVGLATLLTAQLCSPSLIIVVDLDDHRLEVALRLGATHVVNSADGLAVEKIRALTGEAGVDVAVEVVGIPATFDICQAILAPGGHLANLGVHGHPVTLHMERLWGANITLTTRLIDGTSTPTLLRLVGSGRLAAQHLISHRFGFADFAEAYDVFEHAAANKALKVVLTASPDRP